MAKKSSPKIPTSDAARKIWLAGIGAYGRAFSEAQESLAKMSDDTSKLFEDLVERGEEIEDAVESKGRELAKRVNAPDLSLDDRIKKMRARLMSGDIGGATTVDEDRMGAIEERLKSIEEKLDQILSAAPSKTPVRKRSTKTKSTSK